MAISAKDVKKLRDITGAGMMDCKKALTEANGDFDAAIDILRKKGQKVSAKRADRDASEGRIATKLNEDASAGAIVEVNCETDFVARNDEFGGFAQRIADIVLAEKPADADALNAAEYADGRSVGETVSDMMGKIGEKIDIRRFAVVNATEGRVVDYIHPGSRLGVLVDMKGGGDLDGAGRDLAMQIAAMNPVAARVDEVPEEVKQKELEIGRETALNEGKPEHIVDRIAEGKLKRYYKDNVLVEQAFVKDSSMTVTQMLKKADADIERFVRFALGA
ncbi:MAG: translation elongation factor Ts [Bacteroidota bacterium]